MKVICLVICFMCAPISASFYDDLEGAMHSVQQGFGKLLGDVVVDVSDTVHCTISAVEHVLTLNGLIRAKSTYGHKCRDGPLPPIEERDSDNESNDPLENFLKTRDAIEEETYGEATPTHLHTSIEKVNQTLTHTLENETSQRKMDDISKVLKDETEQLTKVSDNLRQELNSISRNVNTELQKFEQDLRPSVWSELEMERHSPELNDIPEAKPAPRTLDKENILEKGTTDVQNSFDDARLNFEHLRDNVQQTSNQFPKDFRDVVRNIRDESYNEDRNKPAKIATGSVFNVDNDRFDQFSPFFDPGSSNDDTHKHVLQETLGIIKDSERTDQIMNMFKQSHAADNVFANPGIFNF